MGQTPLAFDVGPTMYDRKYRRQSAIGGARRWYQLRTHKTRMGVASLRREEHRKDANNGTTDGRSCM